MTAPNGDRPENHAVKQVGRGSSANLVGAAVAATLGIGLAVVVTRGFSRTDAGIFFTATSLAMLAATVARLGTPVGLVYWVARLRAAGRPGQVRSVLRVALTPVIVTSLVLGIAVVVATPWLSDLLFEGSEEAATLLRVLGAFLPVFVLAETLLGATRGFGIMRPSVLLDRMMRPAVQLGLVLAGAAAGSIAWAGAGWSVPYLVIVVVAGLWLRHLLHRTEAAAPPVNTGTDGGEEPVSRWAMARPFWRFTWPRAITSVVQIALQRLDLVLIAAIRSPAEAALYVVATRALVVGQLTNSALGLAAQPQLATLISQGRRDEANDLYRATTAWVILMNGPLFLVAAAFAPVWLGVFGAEYSEAWAITVVVCVAAFLGNAVGMVDVVLSMTNRTTWNLYNALLALTVQVGLNLLLIPSYGAFGAAISWGASILVANLVPLAQLAYFDGLHPFGRGTVVALGVVCLGVALPTVVVSLAVGISWTGLAVLLAVATPLYLAAAWWFRKDLQLDVLLGSLRSRRAAG